jgi:hypothetical protein
MWDLGFLLYNVLLQLALQLRKSHPTRFCNFTNHLHLLFPVTQVTSKLLFPNSRVTSHPLLTTSQNTTQFLLPISKITSTCYSNLYHSLSHLLLPTTKVTFDPLFPTSQITSTYFQNYTTQFHPLLAYQMTFAHSARVDVKLGVGIVKPPWVTK